MVSHETTGHRTSENRRIGVHVVAVLTSFQWRAAEVKARYRISHKGFFNAKTNLWAYTVYEYNFSSPFFCLSLFPDLFSDPPPLLTS